MERKKRRTLEVLPIDEKPVRIEILLVYFGEVRHSSRCCSWEIFNLFALRRGFPKNKGGRFRSSEAYLTYPYSKFLEETGFLQIKKNLAGSSFLRSYVRRSRSLAEQ
ncbi:hypothetical protein [Paenibacillus sp. RC67]|uniref:hypothetical protein n=1 Tax=Paenibacillus sp. RC67 TaxID=3039392 RepID=UPI0024AD4296|nr:hypothetical protein [Paenibacillus sp. RC67]